jgi:hypothetical protein
MSEEISLYSLLQVERVISCAAGIENDDLDVVDHRHRLAGTCDTRTSPFSVIPLILWISWYLDYRIALQPAFGSISREWPFLLLARL